jgi:hypothetical protein
MNYQLLRLSAVTTTLAAYAAFNPIAFAADYSKEGKLDTTHCFAGDGHHIQSTDSQNFGTALNHGVGFSNKPSGSPFDHFGSVCAVVYNTNKAGKSGANGHCEMTDAEGQKWLLAFSDEGNKMAGNFEASGGTGKYEGLKMSGEFKPIGPLFFGTPGHVMRCVNLSGAYKLR